MSIMTRLTNIYLKFNRKILFSANSQKKHKDMKDQCEYLEHFEKPRDVFEKAYFKYKCHAYYHYSFWIKMVYNCAGIIMIPIFLILLALERTKLEDYKDILPKQIKEKYVNLKEVKPLKLTERSMDQEAWRILRKCLMRYWVHPYFCLEVLIRLACNCKLIQLYHPQAIIGYAWHFCLFD